MEIKQTTFATLYNEQKQNQEELLSIGVYDTFLSNYVNSLPKDDPKLMSYHVQQLVSEIGEVLEADKRWKRFRANKFDRHNKLMELADCFIVLINICLFSGFTEDEIVDAILKKIQIVRERIEEEAIEEEASVKN